MKPDCSCLAVAALLLSAAPAAQAIDVCAASDRALVATVLGGAVTKTVPGAPEADKATSSVGASCVFQRGNDALVITVTDFKGAADVGKHVTPASVLSDLGITKSCLMVLPGRDETVQRAGRNLPALKDAFAANINVYDILRADKLLLTKDAVMAIQEVYAS